MNKVLSLKKLLREIQKKRSKNLKIVATSGSFDLLHFGHIRLFKQAKQSGDILIVLLNSDKSIKSYKGPDRPVNSQNQRAEMLAAFEVVDYIVIFNEINPKKILEKIRPDIYFQGSDWGRNCVERDVIENSGGKIRVFGKVKGFSSSLLMKKIIEAEQAHPVRAVILDRDGTININDPEYTHKVEDFKFAEGAIEALKKLSETDYKVIIATNQSGIGRGLFQKKHLEELHKWMITQFEKRGIRIDDIYYCPHAPKENCNCRKPKIGMLMKAVRDHGINLNKSWLVGDGIADIVAGRESNMKTIKIGPKMPKKLKLEPNFYVNNLLEAVNIVISKDD